MVDHIWLCFSHIFDQTQSLHKFLSHSQYVVSISTFNKVIEHWESILTFTCRSYLTFKNNNKISLSLYISSGSTQWYQFKCVCVKHCNDTTITPSWRKHIGSGTNVTPSWRKHIGLLLLGNRIKLLWCEEEFGVRTPCSLSHHQVYKFPCARETYKPLFTLSHLYGVGVT